MIKADRDTISVEGIQPTLMREFYGLVISMMQEDPEIVVSTFSVLKEEMTEAINRCDPTKLKINTTFLELTMKGATISNAKPNEK